MSRTSKAGGMTPRRPTADRAERERRLRAAGWDTCDVCDGRGENWTGRGPAAEPHLCGRCGGEGWVRSRQPIVDAQRRRRQENPLQKGPETMPNEKPGDRVTLVHTSDPYTRLRPGVEGTVTLVDGVGTLHVRWDDGSTLGLIAEAGDRWKAAPKQTDVSIPVTVYLRDGKPYDVAIDYDGAAPDFKRNVWDPNEEAWHHDEEADTAAMEWLEKVIAGALRNPPQ